MGVASTPWVGDQLADDAGSSPDATSANVTSSRIDRSLRALRSKLRAAAPLRWVLDLFGPDARDVPARVASPFVVFERDEVSFVAGSLPFDEASEAATAGAKRPTS